MDITVLILNVVMILFYVAIIGISIADYVIKSLALQKIAKRRQISKPWLSWIPIGTEYIIGSLADEYNSKLGLKSNWKKVMVILGFLAVGSFVVIYGAIIILCFIMILASATNPGFFESDSSILIIMSIIVYVGIIIYSILLSALGICRFVGQLKIFESTIPEKAVKYFVISILVPLGCSICLMKCRNSGYSSMDNGIVVES